MQSLRDLHVLEITGSAAGAYAAKLFADCGARVWKLEHGTGDPARARATARGISPEFAYLNAGKQSAALPAPGRLGPAWRWADVSIESSSPDPPEPDIPDAPPPRLVRVRISPFGSSGPYRGLRSNAFTDEAWGGHLYLNGAPDREPLRRPGLHALYQAGIQGFIGALAALRERDASGLGQVVEVSHFEGLASLHQHTFSMWSHGRHVLRREGNRQPGIWHPVGAYPCKDGHVLLALPLQSMRDRFLAAAGLAELLVDPRFADDAAVARHKEDFDRALAPWLRAHTQAEIVALGQSAGAPVGPVPSALELLEDPQLAAREAWIELHGAHDLRVPRSPLRLDGARARPVPSRAQGAAPFDRPQPDPEDLGASRDHPATRRAPLSGVRVLDLTRVWAGPLAGRFLAELGADVIAVEAPFARGPRVVPAEAARSLHLYPDDRPGDRPWNRVGGFNKLARGKRSLTLDLKRPAAREIFLDLVATADVVLENYSPRVMAGLGLDDATLRARNPSLIRTAISGYGSTGPRRDFVAFGPILEAGAGETAALGYRDSGPMRSGVAWADPVSALHAVAGTLVALRDRDASDHRRGRTVDLSMHEAMLAMSGERLLEAQLRGRNPDRLGNRDPERAPQGVYRCRGEDRWIAISVSDDREWRALQRECGLPSSWAPLALEARLQRHDEIDAQLEDFTRTREPDALARDLLDAGVIAAPVKDARDLAADPQLRERGFFAELDHPDAGRHAEPGCAIRLSATPVRYRRSPTLGEHNAEVLRELGYSEGRIRSLVADGVLVDAPPA